MDKTEELCTLYRERLAIMEAHKNGRKIEFKPKNGTKWGLAHIPIWSWETDDYRVKKVPEEWYKMRGSIQLWSKQGAEQYIKHNPETEFIKLREVLED